MCWLKCKGWTCRADACEQQAKDANLRAERVRAQLLSLDVPCININFSPYTACMRSNEPFLVFSAEYKILQLFLKKNLEKQSIIYE